MLLPYCCTLANFVALSLCVRVRGLRKCMEILRGFAGEIEM